MKRKAILLAMGLVGIGALAYVLHPYVGQAPTLCAFYVVTGKPCPTCGMTRATCALMHGEWAEAMRYHPLVVPFWGALVAVLWAHFVLPLSERTERWRCWSLWAFLSVIAAGALLRIGEWMR